MKKFLYLMLVPFVFSLNAVDWEREAPSEPIPPKPQEKKECPNKSCKKKAPLDNKSKQKSTDKKVDKDTNSIKE